MKMNQLLDVGRITGVHVRAEGREIDQLFVHLQYFDRSNELHELKISVPDAMYLMNILKAVQRQYGIRMPDASFA
jgi:hypothetical protein